MVEKSALLADRVTSVTAEVEIGIGVITIRALSRHEMITGGKLTDAMAQERFILSRAMVEPKLTEDEVATWQKNSPPGEINQVAKKINELSGISAGADKSNV